MNQEEKSRIEELKKSLYSPNVPNIRTKRRLRFEQQSTDIQSDWEHKEETPDEIKLNQRYKDTSMSFFTKILIGSIIFFVLALSMGAYLVFNGSNIVSANNIDITIDGPVSVAGGEPVTFDIQVSNYNNIKLETVDLIVDFPAGATEANDSSKELKNFRELISDIPSGGVGRKTVQAIVYGEENSKKEIKVTIEYRVKGSTSIFKKEKTFDLLIGSTPLTLTVDSIEEVNSGQEFDLTVTMNSNSKEIIKNLLLKSVYPFGFSYVSSDLKPLNENSLWKIGDIPPGGKKVIKIRGKIDGQDDENRIFRFVAGAQSLTNTKAIGTEYINSSKEISIKKPFINIGLSLNGDDDSQEYVASFDNSLRVAIEYFNNLPTPIIDAEVHVGFSGSSFDKNSVSPEQGLYKSADNEIVWNQINTRDLKSIPASGSGRVSFSIIPRNLNSSSKFIINPDMKILVKVVGKRNSESDTLETISSSAERYIKVSSNVSIGGQVIRSTGPFTNTGPIPPKAEQETTYTIVWTIDNTSSSVSNAKVTASIPAHVKWMGKTSPSTENISFNELDGTIVWNVGDIGTYTLNNSTNRHQVSFQVAVTPSVTQVGQFPVLVNQATLTGQDDFTNQSLSSNLNPLTTRFGSDPTFKDGDEKVVR